MIKISKYSYNFCKEIFSKDYFISEEDPLRNGFLTILNNYNDYLQCVKNKNDIRLEYKSDNDFSSFVSSIFPKVIKNIISDDEGIYDVHGSKYIIKNFTDFPWIAITDSSRFDSNKRGYYVAYLFDKHFSSINLCLCFGMGEFTNENAKYIPKNKLDFVIQFKNKFKGRVDELYNPNNEDFNLNNFRDNINLNAEGNNKAISYEYCTIYNKYYDADNLPSEEVLKRDLIEIMKLYEFTKKKEIFEFTKSNEPQVVTSEVNLKNFYQYLKDEGFYFNPETVKNYLLSLKVKPFVILTGNSGTGKTQLSKLFAEFIIYKSKLSSENYKLIPVGANWTETRHIIGFYNVISKKYVSTPSLNLIIDAKNNMSNPYFLILDEMNLSHVERYFSDFLSAIESKKEMPLHNSNNGVKDENGKIIEKELSIPENLFIIGTVNIDETTYMFSPKVLDRANIIEFSTFSNDSGELTIKKYMEDSFEYEEISDEACMFLENPLSNLELRDINITKLKEIFDNDIIWDELSEELTNFHKALSKSNFEFGFRTVNEILEFMYVSKEYESKLGNQDFDNWKIYFDAQIKQKILPKLHGSEILLDTLNKLADCCLDENNEKYPSSKMKIDEMIRILKKQKYVSFIN